MDGDVVVAEVRETSRKPDEVYGLLERWVCGYGVLRRWEASSLIRGGCGSGGEYRMVPSGRKLG